jgi:tetratricopeptide (TPR) repeat protein/predicted Ser/Thr protein kinase
MGTSTHFLGLTPAPSQIPTDRLHLRQPPTAGVGMPDWDSPWPLVTPAGDYELLNLLGRGGMGAVFLARQRGLNRLVAYKVLCHLRPFDPEAVERFRGEAETLARLQHDHIVQVYDSGTEHGTPFIAMEYVSGGSLADKIRDGRPPARDAAALIASVAAAVGHAHAHGIIHRDLKPANILLTPDGRPKVADFGLARDLAADPLTRTGQTVGTPTYMALEQLTGRKDLTPAADVWALGCVLYELLTGAVPFGGDAGQVLINILRHEAVSPRALLPDLPRDLETICLKCLHREPHRRYPTGAELADDLTRFLSRRPILARPVGPVEKGARWCRRNPVVAGLTAGTAALLVAATGVSLALADRAMGERTRVAAAAEAEAGLRRQAERSAEEEKKARREAEELAAALDSLVAGFTSGKDAVAGLRKQLDATAVALSHDAGDPLVRARLLYTLALTRRKIGDYAEAVPLMERSLALRTAHLGADHPVTRKTAHEMSYTYVHVHRGDDAVRVLKPVVEAELAELPPDSPAAIDILWMLMLAYGEAGRTADQEAVGERILAVAAKNYGDDHERTEWVRVNLPRYSLAARRFDEAIPVLEKAYARFRARCGPTSEEVLWTRWRLARCLMEAGRPAEAVPYMAESYEHVLTASGPTHPLTLKAGESLAQAYEGCGRFAEAVPLRRALRDHYRSAGDDARADAHARQLVEDEAVADQ